MRVTERCIALTAAVLGLSACGGSGGSGAGSTPDAPGVQALAGHWASQSCTQGVREVLNLVVASADTLTVHENGDAYAQADCSGARQPTQAEPGTLVATDVFPAREAVQLGGYEIHRAARQVAGKAAGEVAYLVEGDRVCVYAASQTFSDDQLVVMADEARLSASRSDCGTLEVAPVTFRFALHDIPGNESFRISSRSPTFIHQARAELDLVPAERFLFPAGPIALGDGGVNAGWGWHFTDAALVEVAIELCDGRPSMVEADLDYWINTVQRYCPWAAYVAEELP